MSDVSLFIVPFSRELLVWHDAIFKKSPAQCRNWVVLLVQTLYQTNQKSQGLFTS